MHAPYEDKSDVIKDSFCEGLRHVFGQYNRYGMKILLGDFSAKVGREDILKPTVKNESPHEISNATGIIVQY
jgi:hypothetical protein